MNVVSYLLSPLIVAMNAVLEAIHAVIPSYGWSLIALALLVRLVFWPLSQGQFQSTARMQDIAPRLRAIQDAYANDRARLNAEVFALYKHYGVNPFGGCLPLLLQLPILFALYYAIAAHSTRFTTEHFAWIGSPLALKFPALLATSLAQSDLILLGIYALTMYATTRYATPVSANPEQAQAQQIAAIISPIIIAFVGYRFHWNAGLLLYWVSINVITLAQQWIFLRRYQPIVLRSSPALSPLAGPNAS